MSVVLMHLAQNAYIGLKSPFRGPEVQIENLQELLEGDVIKFYYWKIPHVGIVANIESKTDNKANVTIVHYSWPSMISLRTIKEDKIKIDLTKDKVWRLDYKGYDVHNFKEVIRRAKLRIGETKFALFSNRSSHFCFWAKVNDTVNDNNENFEQKISKQNQDENPFIRDVERGDEPLPEVYIDHRRGKLISTNRLEKRAIRIREEIKPGDLIEFKFNYYLFHKAIRIDNKQCEQVSKVELTYVHYGSSYKVIKETKIFDLNRDTINIYSSHPVHRYSRADIINRAENVIGETRYSIFSRRASHFAEEIVGRGDYSEIVATDVCAGDAIIYRYRGFVHEAIVFKVNNVQAGGEKKLKFWVIHYGQEHIFATKEIIKEAISVEKESTIKKKEFKGYYIHPNSRSVELAESRIGEKRFSLFGNTSSDFVHWCKVVQTPFFCSYPPKAKTQPIKVIVIPLTGRIYEEPFHENWIKTKKEFINGSILKVKGQFGILKSINIEANKIDLVFFDQSVHAVNKTEFEIDLKKDKERIWVYSCKPNACKTHADIIQRVTTCLEKENEIPAVTSAWEFCKWCVLIENAESFYKTSIKTEKELTDLTLGSILEVQRQLGILISKLNDKVELVYYNQIQMDVKSRTFVVDLQNKKERIWKYWCNPSKNHQHTEIIERALKCLLSKNEIPAVTSAWEFCKWCVLIENADSFNINLVKNISLLKISEGCVLKVNDQFGILKSIKDNTIKLVCYNQRLKAVKETKIELDCQKEGHYINHKNPIWIYQGSWETCVTRANVIVQVSKCLKIKQNTPAVTSAWEFCKWCVLIENAVKFYKTLITKNVELTKGSILMVKGQFGILKSMKGNKMELVSYDQSNMIFNKSECECDLQKDTIWIYWTDSNICHTTDDIIERASKCFERKSNIMVVTSAWEFCKCCVLIENTESFSIQAITSKNEFIDMEGSILKVKDQFGILKSIEGDTIKLVLYNQSQNIVKEEVKEIKFLSIDDNQFEKEHKHYKTKDIWIYHCDVRTCHARNNVIERASNCLKNVTSAWEFCKWCVLIENLESFNITSIKTTQELANKEGSILKVKGKFGILTSIDGNTIELMIYNQNKKIVDTTEFEVDLQNKTTVSVYQCVIEMNDARDINERALNYVNSSFTSEWEFYRRCVLMESADRFIRMLITTRQELVKREGTIIQVLMNYGILKSIKDDTIELVCYNKNPRLWKLHLVKVERYLDYNTLIKNQLIWVHQTDSSTCHTSDDVIERASKYLERKVEMPPVSSALEFCKWCVLIENADWFKITLLTSKHQLIMTSAGSILKVQGQFGILKSVTPKEIELIFFNQSQKAVNEHYFEFDLVNKKEPIWIYAASESKCRRYGSSFKIYKGSRRSSTFYICMGILYMVCSSRKGRLANGELIISSGTNNLQAVALVQY